METIPLKAKTRTANGSKATRALIANNELPAVVYSKGAQTHSLAIDYKTFVDAVRKHGELVQFDVELDGKPHAFPMILKEIQRDRIKTRAIHCDFQFVKAGEPVKVAVQLKFTGTPKGTRAGGILQTTLRKVKIACPITEVPRQFDLDISPLDIGDGILVGDLVKKYPKITFLDNANAVIIRLVARSASALKAQEKEEKEAAAPAADAKVADGKAADPKTKAAASDTKGAKKK